MACLTKEKGSIHRIHWKFTVRVGPRAGEVIEGSLPLGRCTRAAAKARLRETETWEERVKTGRYVPDQAWTEVYALWLRERELSMTPQSLDRARRVVSIYLRWREANRLPSATAEQVAAREDLVRWRDHRLDHEAGRKTVANDLATLSALFDWCMREKYIPAAAHPLVCTSEAGARVRHSHLALLLPARRFFRAPLLSFGQFAA